VPCSGRFGGIHAACIGVTVPFLFKSVGVLVTLVSGSFPMGSAGWCWDCLVGCWMGGFGGAVLRAAGGRGGAGWWCVAADVCGRSGVGVWWGVGGGVGVGGVGFGLVCCGAFEIWSLVIFFFFFFFFF